MELLFFRVRDVLTVLWEQFHPTTKRERLTKCSATLGRVDRNRNISNSYFGPKWHTEVLKVKVIIKVTYKKVLSYKITNTGSTTMIQQLNTWFYIKLKQSFFDKTRMFNYCSAYYMKCIYKFNTGDTKVKGTVVWRNKAYTQFQTSVNSLLVTICIMSRAKNHRKTLISQIPNKFLAPKNLSLYWLGR